MKRLKLIILAACALFVGGLREQFATANIEQGTPTAPNVNALERKTWKAILYLTGETGGRDLGIIQTGKMNYGGGRDTVKFPIDGNVSLAVSERVDVEPILDITGSQFHSTIKELLLLGTKNTDAVQSSGSAQVANITAKLGRTFDIGARKVTLTTVQVSSVSKTRDVDFFFEENKGLIRFPQVAAGIADGASVVVTFDKPALTRESYTAFNRLNPAGTLVLYEMDARDSTVPRDEWSLPGTFSIDDAGDADPSKSRMWKGKWAIIGQPTVLGRAA